MTWIEAFNRAVGYLPQALIMYAVCWVIFSLATWVLLQAWVQGSLLFIFLAGGQFFSGTMLAAGATIAIAVKVMGDTSRAKGEEAPTS